MSFFRQTCCRILRKLFFLKVRILYHLEGINAVSLELSHCSKDHLPPLLAQYGASVGRDVHIKDGIQIDNADETDAGGGSFANLRIGERVYIGKGVFFDLPEQIHIEAECAISAGVKFLTHQDCGNRMMSRWYPRKTGSIRVGKGSWIGVNSILLQGVELGECCVVAAGSVVRDSFPSYSMVAGSPARLITTLDPPPDEHGDSSN